MDSIMAVVKGKTNDTTWMDMKISYKESKKLLDKNIEKLKSKDEKTTLDVVDLSIERSMRRDLNEVEKEIEKKLLYAFNTLSEDDIKNARLTEREVEIATLRQHKSIRDIAKNLGCSRAAIFKAYKSALRKIERYRKMKDTDRILNALSPQQRKIYKLMKIDKSNAEISKTLGIPVNTVKVQKSRIRKVLKGVNKIG